MGDSRFIPAYTTILESENRVATIRQLSDADVIAALASASQHGEPFVANFLATEAMNRTVLGGAILESMVEAIIVLDREARIRFMNSAAEALLGHLREERIGHSVLEFFARDGGEETALERLLLPLGDDQRHQHDQVLISAGDSRKIDVHVSTTPLKILGATAGVVLVIDHEPVASREGSSFREARRS